MPIKAIDKSNSPLWVKIMVWILAGGLMMASAVGIVAFVISGFSGWEEAGQQQQQQQLMLDEIMAALEEQGGVQEGQNEIIIETDGTTIEGGTDPEGAEEGEDSSD